MSDTIDGMVGKLRQAIAEAPSRSEQFEGIQEEGLRMLVFGKPGSGKASWSQIAVNVLTTSQGTLSAR